MRIGVTGWPAAVSALPRRPAPVAGANAGGGVRGGPWEGGCVPPAGQETDRPDFSDSLNLLSYSGSDGMSRDRIPRSWTFSLVKCGGGVWTLERCLQPYGKVSANVPFLPELTATL
ncbi:hypothetical protein P7K49_023451 [Saguinus oedipus]|uniref:Uncharacterized protein n=1 Tax=Saguinus oedipus TaxID=9490 RepID=A0ABQ9ULN9_SAGOE|nr:hypothetical protein P7K49_023451 [Saguinus oedipus]